MSLVRILREVGVVSSQQVQRSATDVEGGPPTAVPKEIDDCKRDPLPSVVGTHRKTSPAETQPSSSSAAITTQEGSNGYRETAMSLADLEQVELGSIMESSVSGSVLKCARQSTLLR